MGVDAQSGQVSRDSVGGVEPRVQGWVVGFEPFFALLGGASKFTVLLRVPVLERVAGIRRTYVGDGRPYLLLEVDCKL